MRILQRHRCALADETAPHGRQHLCADAGFVGATADQNMRDVITRYVALHAGESSIPLSTCPLESLESEIRLAERGVRRGLMRRSRLHTSRRVTAQRFPN
ncbi:MAG: hypothetical protein ACYDDG_00500 [Casimicrobiaceae bacterium]